tara:strand:- start:496 stop:672 length:177 start_codon:yes stop_codon:yes gene_type:complete
VFAKPEVPILIFIAGLLFFSWPLMEVARALPPAARLIYFFGAWMLLVAINFLIFHRTR